MARLSDRLPENAPGDFFVDASCIDCDLCRQLAPDVFACSDARDQSYVHAQPADAAARTAALLALVACPTSSIGTASRQSTREAARAFPIPVTGNVSFCGYASKSSYGASSYLVQRPEGNVLVDSPRAARPLLERIESLGGVRWMFLTHRDDVADHAVFEKRFGCERVMHRADLSHDTRGIERVIDGAEPVRLEDDLTVIPVPGHTRGSAALLYADEILFSGDHLWASDGSDRLHASRGVCWHSWPEQVKSVERLLAHRFTWVLPGHGRRFHAPTVEDMHAELRRLLARIG